MGDKKCVSCKKEAKSRNIIEKVENKIFMKVYPLMCDKCQTFNRNLRKEWGLSNGR